MGEGGERVGRGLGEGRRELGESQERARRRRGLGDSYERVSRGSRKGLLLPSQLSPNPLLGLSALAQRLPPPARPTT